jgi:transcriptional regulator with XRE-family HTH domain
MLADELGLSRTSVTNIEKGRQPVQIHSLYMIARLLTVELKDLLPSPQLFEMAQHPEHLSVSRSEWLETMNVKLPGGKIDAKKKQHRTRNSRAT